MLVKRHVGEIAIWRAAALKPALHTMQGQRMTPKTMKSSVRPTNGAHLERRIRFGIYCGLMPMGPDEIFGQHRPMSQQGGSIS